MTEGTLSDKEREDFRLLCRNFLDEHATGIHLTEPDP